MKRAKRDLTAEELVERAAAVLRAEGEGALTMRRVAKECGVTAMAVYHHVKDKDELIDRTIDLVVADVLDHADRGPWRADLVGFFRHFRRVMIDNPGVGRIFAQRGIPGPNMARVTERILVYLERGGFTGAAISHAADALVLLLIGSVANDLSRPAAIRDRLLGQVSAEETPLLVRHIRTYSRRDPDKRFVAAVEATLDGLLARR